MGFRAPKKTYRLVFESEDLAGLEVRAASMPLGELLEIQQLADRYGPGGSERPGMVEIDRMLGGFARALLSWNVEDDEGRPVPATLDGLKSLDFDFVLDIMLAWMDAVVAVPAPLAQPSSSGGTSLELSLPMEPLSPSPVLSSMPS